jgi:senataxin
VLPLVLQAFAHLLKLGGVDVWKNQSPELPQVAFDAIKDNKEFSSPELLQTSDQSIWLGWLEPFLQTIVDLNTYSEVLRRVLQAFAEEWQHERFKNIRPTLFAYLMTVIYSLCRQNIIINVTPFLVIILELQR